MSKIDHARANTRDNIERKPEPFSTAKNIAGMGNGRFSPAADRYMGAEPVRRIDPNSPEGRAIIAKIGR